MEPLFPESVAQDDVPTPQTEDEEDQYFYPQSCLVEDVECYRLGGFHPVHLGDCFDNGRFRVLHKLGNGGFATVWLARDTLVDEYVALKIYQAQEFETSHELVFHEFLSRQETGHPGSEYLSLLRSHFTVEGPNGSHLCLVTPVLGPSIRDLSNWNRRLPANEARKAAHQVTQALAYLHSLGVCHGDLTGSNVLLQLAEFNSWTEEQLYDRLGQPWIDPVMRVTKEPPGPTAPDYMVEPIDFSKLGSPWLTSDIQVIDFGEAFYTASPPSQLRTPLPFLAPESIFELKVGVHSDDWALACVIFMIRSGKPLLKSAGFGGPAEAITEIVDTLGPLPDLWDRISFDDEGMPKKEQMSSEEKVIPWLKEGDPLRHSLIHLITEIEAEVEPIDLTSVRVANRERRDLWNQVEPENILRPRNIHNRNHITELGPEDEGAWTFGWSWGEEEERKEKERHRNALKISDEEVGSLYDLLSKALRYDSEERSSTAEIERHEWFVREFPYTRGSV